MKKLIEAETKDPLFQDGLYNVIQRGVRSIKEQKNSVNSEEKTEDSIPALKRQRVLMEKLEYAILYNRVKIEIIF